MSEAEKKWKEWDDDKSIGWYRIDASLWEISADSREAYKAALRREIEKRIESRHLQKVLLILIETVEP